MIDSLVKEIIHPYLKQNSFKKNNFNWNLAQNNITQVINLQKDQYNTKEDQSFTFNCGIFVPDVLNKIWDKTDPKFPTVTNCVFYLRIGELILDRHDKWWNVTPEIDYNVIGNEIIGHLSDAVIPFLSYYTSLEKVHEYLVSPDRITKPHFVEFYFHAVIKYMLNDIDGCIQTLKHIQKTYKNCRDRTEYVINRLHIDPKLIFDDIL